MSKFTLPSTLTDGHAHVRLMSGIKIWFEQDGDLILCTYYVGYTQDDECTGTGATIADAFLAMLVSEWWVGFTTLHPPIAAALDELAHQAVRVVCQRLSGGTMDEATFADYDPALVDPFAIDANPVHCPVCGSEMIMDYDGGELVCAAAGCDARQPVFDEPAPEPGSAEEAFHWGKFQELFPVPFEGNHPRSKEFVLR